MDNNFSQQVREIMAYSREEAEGSRTITSDQNI